MAVDIIARALAAKALNGGGSGGGGFSDVFDTQGTTTYEVGGIPAGTNLEGKTWQQIITMLLYGNSAIPTFIEPSLNVTINQSYGDVGETVKITGTATFDRGSISPAYGTSGFRSGLPLYYEINGVRVDTSVLSYNFETEIQIQSGTNEIVITVYYAAGEQPYDGAGNPYDSPYPAGSLSQTVEIQGTTPIYVKDKNGNLQPLSIDQQFDENGMFEVEVDGETLSGNKQGIAFTAETPDIVGIQQYDPSRDLFDWIYGTPEESLTSFDKNMTVINVNGNDVDYAAYNNNTVMIGPRRLRFFTQLPSSDGE